MQRLESHGTPYWIPELCCQELLQGALDESEWQLLELYLTTQNILTARRVWNTHRDAARIYFDCRRAGITIGSTVDCIVAQQVLDADGVLLHDDADFERIQKVRPLRTLDV